MKHHRAAGLNQLGPSGRALRSFAARSTHFLTHEPLTVIYAKRFAALAEIEEFKRITGELPLRLDTIRKFLRVEQSRRTGNHPYLSKGASHERKYNRVQQTSEATGCHSATQNSR